MTDDKLSKAYRKVLVAYFPVIKNYKEYIAVHIGHVYSREASRYFTRGQTDQYNIKILFSKNVFGTIDSIDYQVDRCKELIKSKLPNTTPVQVDIGSVSKTCYLLTYSEYKTFVKKIYSLLSKTEKQYKKERQQQIESECEKEHLS